LGNSPGTSRMTRVAPFEIAPDSYIGAEPPEKRERPPSLPRPAAIPFLPPDVPDVPSNPRGRSREIHPLYLSSDRPPPLGKTSLLQEECPPPPVPLPARPRTSHRATLVHVLSRTLPFSSRVRSNRAGILRTPGLVGERASRPPRLPPAEARTCSSARSNEQQALGVFAMTLHA